MKKLICLLMSVLIMTSVSFAQTAPAKAPAKSTVAPAKASTKQATTPANATATKTKKDGTADMRYKANKAPKPAAGPVKKDGTPDMRYKANKATPAPKK